MEVNKFSFFKITVPELNLNNLDKHWADIPVKLFNDKDVAFMDETRSDIILDLLRELNIDKEARGLDIGCGNNYLVEKAQKHGYVNWKGIDVNPVVCNSKYGKEVNLRDLHKYDKKPFKVIHCSFVLDYSFNGYYKYDGCPSLTLFARKIDYHLEKDGILLFNDDKKKVNWTLFPLILSTIGYKNIAKDPLMDYAVWKK